MDRDHPSADLLAQARQERARLRLAETRAQEVLALVAGQTPTTGATLPPQAPVVGSSTPGPVSR